MTWAALLALSLAPAFAGEPSGLDVKARYERGLEAKADSLLDQVLGPGKVRVFVDAALDQSFTEETLAAPPDGEPSQEVLPGYRAPRAIRKTAFAKQPVKRLSVSVVADPSLPPEQVQAVINTLTEVLGLDPARGDELRVAKAPLAPDWAKTFSQPAVLRALAVAAGAVGLLLLALPPALLLIRRAAVSAWREARPDDGPWPAVLPAPEGGAPGHGLDLRFVRPRQLRALARFLETRRPAAARWVLGALGNAESRALFRLLSEPLRGAAATEMLGGPQPKPADFRRLEEDLRAYLEREESGPGLLGKLLAFSPDSARERVLEHIRRASPESAGRLRTELMGFEDLGRADAQSLRALALELTTEEWARALQGAPDTLETALLSVLPEAFRDAVRRRRQRLPALSAEESSEARAVILGRWKELEAAGKVRPV